MSRSLRQQLAVAALTWAAAACDAQPTGSEVGTAGNESGGATTGGQHGVGGNTASGGHAGAANVGGQGGAGAGGIGGLGGTGGGASSTGGNPCVLGGFGGFGGFGGSGGLGGPGGDGHVGGIPNVGGAGGIGGTASAGGAGGFGGTPSAGGAGGVGGTPSAGGAGGFGGTPSAGGAGGAGGLGDAGAGGAATFPCGVSLTDARDGHSYGTAAIGSQCWLAENLVVGTMLSSGQVPADNGVIERFCYLDQPANCELYGGLYTWYEAMDYAPSDAGNPSATRGICPEGWHLPSELEWQVLELAMGLTPAEVAMVNAWRGAGAGTALRVGGSSGYEALLSGRYSGTFELLSSYEFMHSSTEFGSNAWRRCLRTASDDVGRWNTFPKSWALSVRCVLD